MKSPGTQLPLPVVVFLLVSSVGFWGNLLSTVVIGPIPTTFQYATTEKEGLKTEETTAAAAAASASSISSDNKPKILRQDLVKIWAVGVGPEGIWEQLLTEGASLLQQRALLPNGTIAVEVGMNRAASCLQAAEAGFEAHCFEPSPLSYRTCLKGVRRYRSAHANSNDTKKAAAADRVHIYNAAVGSQSNGTIHFLNSASTGAHVVKDEDVANFSSTEIVEVPMMKLDDVIRMYDQAYIVKIDVQGFEPEIFRGLQDSIANHKIHYILMEYWPRGMDQMASSEVKCQLGLQILNNLIDAGYNLFQLSVQYHAGEPWGMRPIRVKYNHGRYPPTELAKHCQWFYDMEDAEPFPYTHGYWTDVVAVAPGSVLPEEPLTETGKMLKRLRMNSTIS